jgi:acyl-CoA thioester hydrolase
MSEARDRADDDAFVHRIRVYWEDTDAGGIVFYANYLKFFERARTEWLRSLGVGQQGWREEAGLQFIVTETAVRYLRPARLDDLLDVNVRITERQRASLRLAQQAWCNHTLLAEGDIRIACVHGGTFAPRRIPNEIMERVR